MWLDRSEMLNMTPARHAVAPARITALYRRGILRTKVNVLALTRELASIESMERPCAGALVWITLPGLEARSATVVSSENFMTQLRFTEPFHPAVIDAFLAGRIGTLH